MRVGKGFPARTATHLVQFFGSDQESLVRKVSSFLNEALQSGGSAIVIAGPERREALVRSVGDVRVTYLDAREMLAHFMVDGRPHAGFFDAFVGRLVRANAHPGPLHAYGEMVGYLWTEGRRGAALELEELWNGLLASARFALYCGYPIANDESTERIMAAHTECVGLAGGPLRSLSPS